MKKLMLAAAAICAVTAFAETESAVTSAIVGYQYVDVPKGWSFKTATFKDVSDGAKLDLIDIKPMRVNKGSIVDYDQSVAGKCAGNIYVRFIDANSGMYSDAYKYYSTLDNDGNKNGWMVEVGGVLTKVEKGTVFLNNGEGVIVYSNKSNGTAVFQFSGAVDLVNQTSIPKGWSFEGNNTPVIIDLVDIKPMRINKGVIVDFDQSVAGKCAGNIYIRPIDADSGMYGETYKYYSTLDGQGNLNGWMTDNGTKKVERGSVSFAPGTGYIVYSNKNTGTAIMQLPCPVAKAQE